VADAMTQLGVRQLAEAQTALDTIVQLGVLNTIADSVAVADAIAMISDFSRAESVTAVDQMTPFANMARTESATATDVLGIIDLNTILVFSRPGEFSIGASIMGAAKTPPAPVPWTPAMLPNAKAWFISDSPSNTLVSGELSILADLSGGGFHASAYGGSATNRATLANTLNGRAVWGGDGSSKLAAFQLGGAANAMLNNASGATIFSVHRKTGGADGVLGLWTKNGDFGRARFTLGRSQTSGGDLEAGGRRLDGDGYQGTGDASDQGTGWMIAAGIGDFVNRSLSTWINGTQKFSSSSWQTSGNTSATDSQIALVGAYGTGGGIAGTLVGDQAEVLMIVGALSVADRQNVEGYLAWRWGMQASLPAGHPYKTAAP
jgi:hypothetical protein